MSSAVGANQKSVIAMRDALRNIQRELGLGQAVALLTIAAEPGLSVNDLADRLELPQQTASRYAAILLGRYEAAGAAGPSEALISQEVSVDDPRRRALFLTPEGEALIARLFMVSRAGVLAEAI